MPKRSSKPKREDANQAASRILAKVTGQPETGQAQVPKKNPAAVALGRLGGKKGGVARAKKLSHEQRVEIARRAAQARWASEENKGDGSGKAST